MSYALQVFVSSTCYDLRDLRAAISAWLSSLGMIPLLSDEAGFPNVEGMPPYATCLRVLEQCPLVIGVIDRRYGRRFDDWGPYKEHTGRSPTHAELAHALDLGKRVLVYVQDSIWDFHEVWRKNKEAFRSSVPDGLEESTLAMFAELKTRSPTPPWINKFSNVSDLIASLQGEFVNQLYMHLKDRERQSADQTKYLVDKILEVSPEIRSQVEAKLNPSYIADREALQNRLAELQQEIERVHGTSNDRVVALEREKMDIESQVSAVRDQLNRTQLALASAAIRDSRWFEFLRRTMRPRQTGRVPFHHTGEVALRGYQIAGDAYETPQLREVTWSRLPTHEDGLARRYSAGLVFTGEKFAPGVTYAQRPRGSTTGGAELTWWLPSSYFGDRLEVGTSDDEAQSALSYRDQEFQVRNPGTGKCSEWVAFLYAFNYPQLAEIRDSALEHGLSLLDTGRFQDAIAPLLKASNMTRYLRDSAPQPKSNPGEAHQHACEQAALARLRFRMGDMLIIHDGPNSGKSGVVTRLLLNHLHAYLIRSGDGSECQASDAQVERAPNEEHDRVGT